MRIKKCSKCSRVYPATLKFFHKSNRGKNQLYSWCKKCVCCVGKLYRSTNKKKIQKYLNGRKEERKKQAYEYRINRKKQSLCVRCGKKKGYTNKVECYKCRKKKVKIFKRDRNIVLGKAKKYRQIIKQQTIRAYGGKCACCGVSEIEFLTIDHINGGGEKHRASIGKVGGSPFYRWLKNNDYPKGFRVLCWNCNLSFGLYNYCPHRRRNR